MNPLIEKALPEPCADVRKMVRRFADKLAPLETPLEELEVSKRVMDAFIARMEGRRDE